MNLALHCKRMVGEIRRDMVRMEEICEQPRQTKRV